MIRVFRNHPVLVSVLVLSVGLAVFFGGRFVLRAVYFAQHAEEPVAGWMTVGYVGRSWGFDPRAIDRLAGLPPPEGRPFTLEEIARARGVPVAEVVAQVEAALEMLRAVRARQVGEPP